MNLTETVTLPPTRNGAHAPIAPPTQVSRVKELREDLIEALRTHKAETKLTDEQLGRLLGYGAGTPVTKALNKKFEGDAPEFTRRLEDYLRNAPARRQAAIGRFPTAFVSATGAFLQTVLDTDDVGVAYSAAGQGKTEGIAAFCLANPLTVSITLSEWARTAKSIAQLLFDQIENRGYRGDMTKGAYLVARFRGSRRLIVIDNAHRLASCGRKFVFDFHDATGCPIALVGNPELLDLIRRNDQQFSRVGLRREIKGKAPSADADRMVALIWPDAVGKLGKLPLQVVKGHGHLRALRKQLLLARDIAGDLSGEIKTHADAFRAAHTQLIRDYALDAD